MSHGVLLDATQFAEQLLGSRIKLEAERQRAIDAILRWSLVVTVTLPAEVLALQYLRPLAMFIPAITLIGIVGVVQAMFSMARIGENYDHEGAALRATLPIMQQLRNDLSLSVIHATLVDLKIRRGYAYLGREVPDVVPVPQPAATKMPTPAPAPLPQEPTDPDATLINTDASLLAPSPDAMDFERHVDFSNLDKPKG